MAREICPAGIVAAEGDNGLISALLASGECGVSSRVSVMFVNVSPSSSPSFYFLPPANSSLQSETFVKGWVVAKTWSHFFFLAKARCKRLLRTILL